MGYHIGESSTISSLRMQSITFHRQLVVQQKPQNNYTFLIHYHLSSTCMYSIVILVGNLVQTYQLQSLYYLTYITVKITYLVLYLPKYWTIAVVHVEFECKYYSLILIIYQMVLHFKYDGLVEKKKHFRWVSSLGHVLSVVKLGSCLGCSL